MVHPAHAHSFRVGPFPAAYTSFTTTSVVRVALDQGFTFTTLHRSNFNGSESAWGQKHEWWERGERVSSTPASGRSTALQQ